MQNRVRYRDLAHVLGHVGEHMAAGNVPRGIDVLLRSPAVAVDVDGAFADGDAGGFQSQAFDRRLPSDRRENRIASQSGSVVQRSLQRSVSPLDADGLVPQKKFDPLLLK